jgi:hypothetical protein
MDKILNNEITNSIKDTIKSRLNSSVYGTFLIFWLIFHWRFVYTLFFVDERIIWSSMQIFKNDYLIKTFFDWGTINFYIWWVLPFIFTYLAIWILPHYVLLPAFQKEQEYEFKKRKLEINNEKKLIDETTELQKAKVEELEVVEEKVQKEQKIKEATDPEVKWKEEYKQFIRSGFFSDFNKIIKSIYQNNGDIKVPNEYGNIVFQVPENLLAYVHVNDLVILDKHEGKIELTEKGKFFVKQFSLSE